VCVLVYAPLSLLGNGSIKIPLSLLGNYSVKIHLIVATQWLDRNVTTVTNTHATIEELLDASFSMWSVSYQGKLAIISSQNFLFIHSVIVAMQHQIDIVRRLRVMKWRCLEMSTSEVIFLYLLEKTGEGTPQSTCKSERFELKVELTLITIMPLGGLHYNMQTQLQYDVGASISESATKSTCTVRLYFCIHCSFFSMEH
jgi:hypothetical protein